MGIMQQYNLSHLLHVGKTQSMRRKLILGRMEADQSFSVSCIKKHEDCALSSTQHSELLLLKMSIYTNLDNAITKEGVKAKKKESTEQYLSYFHENIVYCKMFFNQKNVDC